MVVTVIRDWGRVAVGDDEGSHALLAGLQHLVYIPATLVTFELKRNSNSHLLTRVIHEHTTIGFCTAVVSLHLWRCDRARDAAAPSPDGEPRPGGLRIRG